LTERRIAYSLGMPCEQPFLEMRWPGVRYTPGAGV
jgi:hypothetical protein